MYSKVVELYERDRFTKNHFQIYLSTSWKIKTTIFNYWQCMENVWEKYFNWFFPMMPPLDVNFMYIKGVVLEELYLGDVIHFQIHELGFKQTWK